MKVRAIWINAEAREVEERQVEIGSGDTYAEARKLIGGWLGQGGRFDHGNVLFVDDDGRLKQTAFGFRLEGAQVDYFVGNGLVLGIDREGETVNATLDLGEVTAKCSWVELGNVAHARPAWQAVPLDNKYAVGVAAELRRAGVRSTTEAAALGYFLNPDPAFRAAVDRVLLFWQSQS